MGTVILYSTSPYRRCITQGYSEKRFNSSTTSSALLIFVTSTNSDAQFRQPAELGIVQKGKTSHPAV